MTVGNIATDGYGLNAIEKPNVPVNGYGGGLPTGLFEGSVTGIPIADEIIEGFFDELLLIDSTLEHVATLVETVEVTELVGIPMAQSLMVGVPSLAAITEGVHGAVALEGVGTHDETMDATASDSVALGASQSQSATLDAELDASSDMMGSDDTETGVV
jgi:hypothetical protein